MSPFENTSSKGQILVVDDEEGIREMLTVALRRDGFQVANLPDGIQAVETIGQADCAVDLVLMDLKMPHLSGIGALKQIKSRRPDVLVIIMTAYSTWDTAVEAMRLGAFDYIRKPFDTVDVKRTVNRAIQMKRQSTRGGDVDADPCAIKALDLVGNAPKLQHIHDLIRSVGPTDSTVLIQGESGTGKELVARAIHQNSLRAGRPFVTVNCGAFTETLLQSELFGHVRGAFTGAVRDRQGVFDVAEHGTLFLDEIGEMSLEMQVKFLRLLEDREFIPVGSPHAKPMDIRLVTATNRNLEEAMHRGAFRSDLYYRLNVIPIYIPPLRDRRDDIPLLAGHFLARYAKLLTKPIKQFAPEVVPLLVDYRWPGNVRELENVIHRMVALCERDMITLDLLPDNIRRTVVAPSGETPVTLGDQGVDLPAMLARMERDFILQALKKTHGNLTQAADLLGMTFRTIRYKVKKLGIEKDHV